MTGRRPRGLLARLGLGHGGGRDGIGRVCRIARFPITQAQYLAFAQAPDYGRAAWWREGFQAPTPETPSWDQPNRPRVLVAWVEALAFCRWLTEHSRTAGLIRPEERIRLPTESEWTLAATGGDGREYPWGQGYRVGHANCDEAARKDGPHHLGETAAVGLYPQGVSPWVLHDCAGNVWEWCLNKYKDPTDVRTQGDARRALRGGSWNHYPAVARAAYRNGTSRTPDTPQWVIVWCVRAPFLWTLSR